MPGTNQGYDKSVHDLKDADHYEISGESEYTRERSDPYEMVDYLLDKDFTGKGPRGYARTDAVLYEEVCEALYRSPHVDASDIEVEVKDGCVFLSGTVESRETKKMAEIEIDSLSGIKDVQNKLQVSRKPNGEGYFDH
jgi:osmotically-inducible protein OsmY